MPITTLQNISIPTEGANSNSSLLMPKLQYRFRVFLDNFGTTGGPDGVREITRQVQDVTRPNISFEQMTLDAYNSRTYLAGKHTWEPVTLTLREDANNNVQKIIGQQLQRQFDFFEQSSAVSSGTYKFQTRIEILDGGNGANTPSVLETFELVGCFVQDINYNQLTYSDSNPVDITMSLQYDNAIQTNGAGQPNGIGSAIGRTIRTLATG